MLLAPALYSGDWPPPLLISAVFPDGYAANDEDEALQIWNTGPEPVDLGGWRLSAGGGSAAFPPGACIEPGQWLWLARNDQAFERTFGHRPDWSWQAPARDASAVGRAPMRLSSALPEVGPFGNRALCRSSGDRRPANQLDVPGMLATGGGRQMPENQPDMPRVLAAGGGHRGPANQLDVPRMLTIGGGPALANRGSVVSLADPRGQLADTVVYGQAGPAAGWLGPPVRAYRLASVSSANQILYRKLNPATASPIADTDQATDWASDARDPLLGRRVRFPGWDLETMLRPTIIEEVGWLQVAIAPDHLFDFLASHLRQAQRSIDLMLYSFDQPDLAELLAERLASGVQVRLLLDGNPAGGIDANKRWCAARIAAAGGQVYWHDDAGEIRRRYRGYHPKLALIDGRVALIGSENFSLGSAPNDDLADGTSGRRGIYLATAIPGVVTWLSQLIERDLALGAHLDVRPFQSRDPARGAPLPDYVPTRNGGGAGYIPIIKSPLLLYGRFQLRLLSAPESAMDVSQGLLGLLERAGPGDEVLVEQLREAPWWGDPATDGEAAANMRLAAYLDAARRGARVRVLLDSFFDDPSAANSNAAVCAQLNSIATAEHLPLEARTGNPTGGGLHNKMILLAFRPAEDEPRRPVASAQGEYWNVLGSLNGTEISHKANREVAIALESQAVYSALASVFAYDWARSGPGAVFLPYVAR